MTDSFCSCCQIFGQPKARVNFIILACGPDSVAGQRTKYLLQKYPETNTPIPDSNLTNYDALMSIYSGIHHLRNPTSEIDSSTTDSSDKCCYGFLRFPYYIDNSSDTSEYETFRQHLLDLLNEKADENLQELKATVDPPSWVLLHGSIFFEPVVLDIFIKLKDQNVSVVANTFNIFGLILNENQLFESWLCRDVAIEDYEKNTYPQYEKRIEAFFSFLNSSKSLQEHTVLVEESRDFNNDELREILKHLFRQRDSKYSSINSGLRSSMEKLLQFRHREVKNVKFTRGSLLKSYQENTKPSLESLVIRLKHSNTAGQATRELFHLVLNELTCVNKERKRAYRRQLLCGFHQSDPQNSNTVAAQMTFYALRLLQNYDDSTVPFLYAVIMIICEMVTHFVFRHELFSHTPEIFTLSLLLVSQRHYALAMGGLRLCWKILDADQNEHKYAGVYLRHDPLTARKLLDAIIWLLSSFQQLKKLWDEKTDAEPNNPESPLSLATKHCFEHAEILLEQAHLRTLASLFFVHFDHCLQVTEDDVHQIVTAIEILTDSHFPVLCQVANKSPISSLFVLDLCAFLTPILLNGPASISLVLVNETRLMKLIPTTIASLLNTDFYDKDKIDIALRFYTQLIQSKIKPADTALHSSKDEQITENNSEIIIQPITPSINSLCLTKDLLASYYNLHRQYQRSILRDDMSAQQEQVQLLFEAEWKKIDTLQLKHDYDQLKQEHQVLNENVEHLGEELQQTQLERDQYRRENTQMAQEIESLKLATPTNVTIQSARVTTTVPIKQNNNNNQTGIIDQLKDLLPQQIKPDQAKNFIEEICRRRTEFDDEDMRKSICGSLKRLGSDLYSSPVHFLHELIQNAEDNTYVDEAKPYLRIELNHDYILFSNNEQGLRPRDILAICSLAVTTKSSEQKHIGEKGVGFKSVFAASNQPMLFSHSWKFRFQVPGDDAMSYITPLWINDQDVDQCIANQISANRQHTHLYLPLKLTPHTDSAKQFLDDVAKAVDPCILLNMRKLEKLEVVDQREGKEIIIEKHPDGSTKLVAQRVVEFEDLKFLDLIGLKMQLSTPSGDRTFRVYTCQIDVPSTIEERTNRMTTLTLAFPCEYNYDLTATVYNGLPVCDLGFKFMFNAEFHLVTSRENVRENVLLNSYLRDHLAVLFVYLLLNDTDLKKDISHYCPSSNIHQVKHSFWWRSMIGRINQLIENHLSVLFGIGTGKEIRSINPKISSLISKEQLDDYANIQVIDSNDEFFTVDRLKSLHIQTVSIKDVLKCFPNRHESTNDFLRWTQKQDQRWWSHLFHHLSEGMTPEVSGLILQKPIFLLQDHYQRQYLPEMSEKSSLLYINDDQSIRIWKRRLTILRYGSAAERTALIRSNHVQSLTEKELIDTIQNDHLQLSVQPTMTPVDDDVLEEIWKDLSYLQARIDKLDKAKPLLVPIHGSSRFTLIQNTTLPTFFGRDMRSFMDSTVVTFVRFPFYEVDPTNALVNHLQWEYFLLKMHCKPPSINLPQHYTIARLPCLPSFTMFTNEEIARLGEFILSVQPDNTLQALRQFPIVAQMNSEEQFRPIETTFDQLIIPDLPSLPRIDVPSYCRSLAMKMGVCTDYDLNTCMTILRYLGDEKITNINLYSEWLGRLQLEVRQNNKTIDKRSFRSTCQLYLPDQQQFCPLKHVLVMSEINDQNRQGILLVCKYLKLQLISPTTNQTYSQFNDLFHVLDCQCTVTIENIYRTISLASNDKHNFYSLGNHLTILKENGLEVMITLFQYLEHSIVTCVADSPQDSDLYRAVITEKHPTAPCGSREDLQWRFALTSKVIASELKKLTGVSTNNVSLPLLTFDDKLIAKTYTNIIYASLEIKIIQNLSRARDKRHFISVDITQKCPLVLALSEIDYVERRGAIKWAHRNMNLEYHLSQLTRIFREATDDRELEVVSAKYADIHLLISDASVCDTVDDEGADVYQMETDYPFLIFNKTILLCSGNAQDDSSRAIIAISALATLLHKRQYLPFEEAKLIARQRIADCTEFVSRVNSSIASTKANLYFYLEMVFPTDHDSLKSITVSISGLTRIEADLEENFIAPERSGVDEIYRKRAEEQDHRDQHPRTPGNWMNPAIVDGEEHIRVGQNAEHFFFTYLQKLYGSSDVKPIKNWRSSARLVVYPQYTRDVNDSAGYDLELHDTKELFTRGTKSRTKRCYFEVKGTSGSFHEEHASFHISQNELEKCQSIAFDSRRREHEAYFLVVIEHCLDPEKIALAKTLDWSSQFLSVELRVDSYQCRFLSTPPVHTTPDYNEDTGSEAGYQRYEEEERRGRPSHYGSNRGSWGPTDSDNESSNSFRDNRGPCRGQEHRHPTNFNNEPSPHSRINDRPCGGERERRSDQPWRSLRLQHEQVQDSRTRARGPGRRGGGADDRSGINSNWRRQ